MYGPSDWAQVTGNDTLPHTCCLNVPAEGICTMANRDKYEKHCLDELKDILMRYGTLIGGVGVGIASVQV